MKGGIAEWKLIEQTLEAYSGSESIEGSEIPRCKCQIIGCGDETKFDISIPMNLLPGSTKKGRDMRIQVCEDHQIQIEATGGARGLDWKWIKYSDHREYF